MPDVYCELHDGSLKHLGLSKYVTFYALESRHPYNGKYRIAHAAERIWIQDDDGIAFVKNRHSDPNTTPVDMEEFMWVKLASIKI